MLMGYILYLNVVSVSAQYYSFYCDGGPDHRLTYVYVQLSLIALFFNLHKSGCLQNCTKSYSWKNPVERIISLLNIQLQCVGVMGAKMSDEIEDVIILKQLRERVDSEQGKIAPF